MRLTVVHAAAAAAAACASLLACDAGEVDTDATPIDDPTSVLPPPGYRDPASPILASGFGVSRALAPLDDGVFVAQGTRVLRLDAAGRTVAMASLAQPVRALAVSGETLAASLDQGGTALLDTQLNLQSLVPGASRDVDVLGDTVAIAGGDRGFEVVEAGRSWSVASSVPVERIALTDSHLVAGLVTAEVMIFDRSDLAQPLELMSVPGPATRLSRDGAAVWVSCGDDGVVRLTLDEGAPRITPGPAVGGSAQAVLQTGGATAVAESADGVSVWDSMTDLAPMFVLETRQARDITFAGGAHWIADGPEGVLRATQWDAAMEPPELVLAGATVNSVTLTWGRAIGAAGIDGIAVLHSDGRAQRIDVGARVLEVASNEENLVLRTDGGFFVLAEGDLSGIPNPSRFESASEAFTVLGDRVLLLHDGALRSLTLNGVEASSLPVDPGHRDIDAYITDDGVWVVAFGIGSGHTIWNGPTVDVLTEVASESTKAVATAFDGERLFIADPGGSITTAAPPAFEPEPFVDLEEAIRDLAWSPRGLWVATRAGVFRRVDGVNGPTVPGGFAEQLMVRGDRAVVAGVENGMFLLDVSEGE